MKRRILWGLWCLAPLLAIWTHVFYGAEYSSRDRAQAALARARTAVDAGEYKTALTALDEAIAATPKKDTAKLRQLRLIHAQVSLERGRLQDAYDELNTLKAELDDPSKTGHRDEAFLREFNQTLAAVQFFGAWRMRLQGTREEVWKQYAEASRQTYRQLARNSSEDAERQSLAKDGEAVIQMERLPLQELKTVEPRLGEPPQRQRQQKKQKQEEFQGEGDPEKKKKEKQPDAESQEFDGDGPRQKGEGDGWGEGQNFQGQGEGGGGEEGEATGTRKGSGKGKGQQRGKEGEPGAGGAMPQFPVSGS